MKPYAPRRTLGGALWGALAFFWPIVVGCGTESTPPYAPDQGERDAASRPTPTADAGRSNGSSSSVETNQPKDECVPPVFEDDSEARPFQRLSATVQDEAGKPVVEIVAQACGTNVCLQAKTNAQGRVSISESTDIAKLAFKYGDGLRYAQLVVEMPDQEVHELGIQTTLRLPEGVPDNRLQAGASVESSDARLTLSAETSVGFDVLSYPDEAQHVFVAREFEREVLPASVAARQFNAVWVLGPQKTTFCPPAALTLPNTASLPAGAAVDLYLLVTGIEGHFARYAEWGKVGSATVSDDGSRIQTDLDSGLPELGIIGLQSTERAD